MEFEFSQDGVLNFLRSQGGRVKNAELRAHFQSYIDEPGGREKFKPSQDVHSGILEAPVSTLSKASPANLPPSAEEIPSMHRWAVYAAMGEFYKLEPLVKKNITILFMKDSLSGYTALHWAAKHGFVDALTWMGKMAQSSGILLPVDVRSNGAGLTALHLAAAHGRDDAIRVLVRFLHANPSLRDYGGRKALHYLPLEMVSLQARQLLEPSPMKMLLHVPRRTSQPIKAHDQHLLSFFKPPKSPRCPRK
uniref:SOWAHA-C winged helix-turn-helix domain-containing protein n=1 Tax=Eptatretus burgeri TaxID=7764 RepID=A0A8C4NNC6_EPTBU